MHSILSSHDGTVQQVSILNMLGSLLFSL